MVLKKVEKTIKKPAVKPKKEKSKEGTKPIVLESPKILKVPAIPDNSKEIDLEGKDFDIDKISEKGKKFFEAIGRRKTSTARVRLLTSGKKDITINKKLCKDYFPAFLMQKTVEAPLEKLSCLGKFGVEIIVKGGGISAQAEACRHGLSRVLVLLNPYFKKKLRKSGFLTRDARMRERKKFGLKRARRAPQWSKR